MCSSPDSSLERRGDLYADEHLGDYHVHPLLCDCSGCITSRGGSESFDGAGDTLAFPARQRAVGLSHPLSERQRLLPSECELRFHDHHQCRFALHPS